MVIEKVIVTIQVMEDSLKALLELSSKNEVVPGQSQESIINLDNQKRSSEGQRSTLQTQVNDIRNSV